MRLTTYTQRTTIDVPHFGQVGAGTTVDLFDHPRFQSIIKPRWARSTSDVVTVTVSGTSLLGEGIWDGDTLVVQRISDQSLVRSGRLVIVRLSDGRCLVKRIYFEGHKIILRSANSRFPDMTFGRDEIVVEGIVKNLTRDLI